MTEQAQQNGNTAIVPDSLVLSVAKNCGMDEQDLDLGGFKRTLQRTVIKDENASTEQIAAFLMVAKEYNLNPITKEIYAFPDKKGGVQPIVSVDGWLKIVNDHPQFDGMDFEDHKDETGYLTAITCRMYRKDRSHPVVVTEYMAECRRSTDPWKNWPSRMLRHKTLIQCARYAFGFSGIMEPDEYERGQEVNMGKAEVVAEARPEPESMPDDKFQQKLEQWRGMVEAGTHTPDDIVSMVGSRYTLTDEQHAQIHELGETENADH